MLEFTGEVPNLQMGLRRDDFDELPGSGSCIYVDDLHIGERLHHGFDRGSLGSTEWHKAEHQAWGRLS
jgi:hypothetical protein